MPESASTDMTAAMNAHRAGFDVAMGFRYVRVAADEVVMEYEIGAQHRQPYGIVHGGVHCAIVESACSTGAGMAALARGQSVVGVENHTSFIHAEDAGSAVAAALRAPAGIYNVVDDEPMTRAEAGQVLAAANGRRRALTIPRPLQAMAPASAKGLAASLRESNAKLKAATGWAPAHPSIRGSWPGS